MPEYRKIIETPPVTLHREDIEDLARILTEKLPVHPRAFDFSFSYCDAHFRADSLEELLQQKLPPAVDSLTFSVLGWRSDESGIDRGITISLCQTTGYYQIHALVEIWFKGKIQQINEFLNARRRWYAPIRLPFAGLLLGACIGAAFSLLLFFIHQRSIVRGAFAGLSLVLLSVVVRKFVKGSLFPKAKIMLQESTSKFDKDIIMLIITALSAIATALGVIVQFYLSK